MDKLLNQLQKLSLKQKKVIIFVGILLIISLLLGISYSYYLITLKQEGSNIVRSACFKITYEDKNDIYLNNVYPYSDEEGKALVPYEFTIKNICKMAADYQVNLETLSDSSLNTIYLRGQLDDNEVINVGNLDTYETYVNPDVKESRKLASGILVQNEEITYNLRLWVDEDSTVEQSSDKKWSGKVVVISTMDPNPYRTITLNPTGGALESNTMQIVKGRVIGDLPIPQRNGYTFNGWYTEEESGEQVTEATIVNENQELFAHWNRNRYDLVVNPNEGEWETYTAAQTYHLDYEEEKEISEPTRTGYHFTNWTLTGNESTINGTTFKMGYENSSITANYEKNTYKLNIVDTYGSDNEYNLLYEEEKEIEEPTREGYTFTGWELSGNGSTINTTTFKMGHEDATLRATWEANDYPYIALHYQENINDDEYTLVDADTEEGTLPLGSKKTPEVKTYTGFTSPSSKEITIQVDSNPPTKNKVEYQYTRNKYSIIINLSGGKYSEEPSGNIGEGRTDNIKYQKSIIIENPSKEGYTFSNWTVAGTGSSITNKVLTMGYEDVTLTANYTINTYIITYNANGGSVSPGSATVNHGSTLSLPTPTRTGYRFDGWYTASSGGSQVSNSTTWTSSQIIYAHWTAESYTISYTLNSGSCSSCPTSYTIESNTFTLPTPTRAECEFTGWTGSNGSTAQTSVSIPKGSTGNKSYTASFNCSISTTDLKIGDIVNYSVTGNEGNISQWVVIKEGSEPELVAKTASPDTYTLASEYAYLSSAGLLNQEAASYGTNNSIVLATRSFGYSNQTLICTDIDSCPVEKNWNPGYRSDEEAVTVALGSKAADKEYWVVSRVKLSNSWAVYYNVYSVLTNGNYESNCIYWVYDDNATPMIGDETCWQSGSHSIRPIITLRSTVKFIKTSSTNTYNLIL